MGASPGFHTGRSTILLAGVAVKPATAPKLTLSALFGALRASTEPYGYVIVSALIVHVPTPPSALTFTKPSVLVPFATMAWMLYPG